MDSQVVQPTVRLDSFLWCRLISLQQCMNKLLHQIDLACKTGNLVLIKEILLPSLPDEDDDLDQEAFENHLRQLLNHIAHLFHSSICDSTQSWLIHLIATQLRSVISLFDKIFDNEESRATFELISDRNYSQLYLICSNHLLHSGLKCEDVLDFYTSLEAIKSSEKEHHIQSMIIKLKNSLFQSSTFTSFVINIFSKRYDQLHGHNEGKLNLFDKIYLQALIHTLKNENKRQMTEILLRCPDAVLHDENLLCQIIEYFQSPQKSSHSDHLLDLYSSCLFRFTPQLITSIYSIRFANLKYRVNFFNTESSKFFNLKECFLLAVHENKHFLAQFCKVYCNNHKNPCDISRLPVKAQILLIVISLYDLINSSQNEAALFIERISRFESSLSKLLLKYECENFDKDDDDQTFSRIVCKLRFILTFADWCHSHINQSNLDRNSFCYKIIVSLLSGSSPLKILSGHGFLELMPTNENVNSFKEVVYDEICLLISQYDLQEAMVLKGFVVLRLLFFCILSKEDENVYFDTVQIKNLIEDIMPIEFRIEIMENIFSLLFLTKSDFNHHFNLNCSEDDDYLDETLSNTRQKSSVVDDINRLTRKKLLSDLSKNTYFFCPNWIIPKILELLKDVLYKTSSDLYSITHGQADANAPQVWKTIDFEECKARIAALMRHVGDARFRYDVIRPAFYKNISAIQSSIKARGDNTVEAEAEGFEDSNQMDLNRDLISAASSDNDHQKSSGHLSTSLISCMLASYTQLLCYTLIENSLENAGKIARLFQEDLKNSKELKELQLLEYFSELHSKIGKIQSSFSDSSTTLGRLLSTEDVQSKFKTGEIANLGILSSNVQAVVFEMLQKMDKVDNVTKKVFMIDYSLCASPSLEVSQAILEALFVGQHRGQLYQTGTGVTGQVFPEKVELFLAHFQRLISDLSTSLNTSQLSIVDYFQKSLASSPLLDAKSFITTLHFESELRRAYCEFYRHLNYLENRLIDDPDLLSASDADVHFRKDSQLLLTLFDKIVAHCPAGKFHYLNTLLLYVRKVSKALGECKKRNLQANKEGTVDSSFIYTASYFSILKQSPSAILCSMVIKSKISPKIIDDMALIMKVNLMGVLCSVYCPSIATCFLLHDCNLYFFVNELVNPCLFELIKFYSQGVDAFAERSIQSSFVQNFFAAEEVNASFGDNSFEQSFQPLINSEVLTYFNSKCSVLVELLRILNLINDQQLASVSPWSPSTLNMHIAEQSPLLRWVERIKSYFFYGDTTSTVSLALHPRIVSGHPAVIKTLEYCIANQKYKQVYELFRYIDDISSVPTDADEANSYQLLQDAVFSRLAFIEKNAKFAFQIAGDSKMKCEVVCRLLTYSENYDETFMATRLIRLCLQSIQEDESIYGVDSLESRKKLEKVLCEIEFYAAVGQLTGLKNWKLSKDNLESIDVLTIIKTKKRYHLAIDWYKIKGLEKETCDLHIELLIHAYSELNDYASLRQLCNAFVDQLQSADVIAIVEKTLSLVDNLELRSFLVDLLATHYRKRMNFNLVESYEQYKLGIEMVKLLSEKIRGDYLKLASSPLLLVEQLLMNCEIDSLERIINQYKLIQADELVERYAQKSVHIEIYDAHSFNSSADLTPISSSFNDSSSINRSTNTFVVPEKIPSRDQWISDTQETHCMICHLVRFSMINRRHHCRRCGRVVCQACSANTFLIPEININSHVRVCNDCYVHLKQKTRRASTHSSNSSTSSTTNRRTAWYLLPGDEVTNDSRRFEFFYETAPSVTLCLAILHLHSDQKRCCKFIIDKICAPLLETTDSRYVDSTLLIEMIRSLLMSTCISIEEYLSQEHRKERIPEIEQLSLYLDRLDVIRMMINSNYGTKEMIGYVLSNNIQKLQEKLLEMERFELAIDIAKKYGLDSSSIWKTWAIICLKHLQFADARRKFNRYFDQTARASDDQLTLKNIVDILVRSNSTNLQQMTIKEKCNQILASKYDFLSDRTDLAHPSHSASQMTPSAILQQRSHLKPRIYQEIVYYIKQYGTADDLLHFYVEHHYWKEAVEYFIGLNREQAASANTCNHFLNTLFIPAQMKGSLGAFFAAIRQSDPQLAVLWSALITICRHLAKNEYFNSLYRVQIFMSDYLRAAITQINYFFLSQRTASGDAANEDEMAAITDVDSFDLLYRRIGHLEKARDNCNMYLHNVEYVKLKPGCLHVEKKDVLKQIRLIEVQMDILKRFKLKRVKYPLTYLFTEDSDPPSNRYLPLSGLVLRAFQSELAVSFTGRSHFPPTLLEHDLVRKSQIAALMILYFSDSLEEGFRHSLRIIQEHQLNSSLVYKMTAGFLLAHELEKNSSAATMLDLLGQLLVYVRSSCMAEHGSSSSPSPAPGTDQSESGFFSSSLAATSRSISFSRTLSTQTSSGSSSRTGTPPPLPQLPGPQAGLQALMNKLSDDIVTSCIGAIKLILDWPTAAAPARKSDAHLEQKNARAKFVELSESLIKLLSDDKRRIEAYLQAGKLKLAYLLAVSLGQRSNVIRVLDTARQSNDQHFMKICEMWLRKNVAAQAATAAANNQ